MATPVSSATSYASATDLINAHEVGKIGDWATDTKVRLTPTQILTDTIVAAALLRGSGEVEMACFRGGRYTPTDLASLTGASAAALKGLVADIAFYRLAKRRLNTAQAIEAASYKEAMETLKAINQGELIFGLQEAADAGVISTVDLQLNSRGLERRPTELAGRLFGRRMDNDPFG